MSNARARIRTLLMSNVEREWTCREVSDLLAMSVRTVASVIAGLVADGHAQKVYGKKRKMTFRAHVPPKLPLWMSGITAEHIAAIERSVISSRVHVMMEQDDDCPVRPEVERVVKTMRNRLMSGRANALCLYYDEPTGRFAASASADRVRPELVVGYYSRAHLPTDEDIYESLLTFPQAKR